MPELKPMGTEPGDLPTYYISIGQKMTKGVGDEFKYGDVIVRPGPMKLELEGEPGFEGIVAFRVKARHRTVEGQHDCQGIFNGGWFGTKYGPCDECQFWNDGTKNRCGWQYNYFVRVTRGWPQEAESPVCILAMERTSLSAAKSLNSLFLADGDLPFRSVFRFGTRDGTGEYEYKVWTVKRIGPTPKEILGDFEADYVQLQGGSALPMLIAGSCQTGNGDDRTDFKYGENAPDEE